MPLKIDTDGQDWAAWSRKYTFEGNGIPILYVIRADGQQLYGRSGGKPGGELPQFLSAQLENAGTIFTVQQLTALRTAVSGAQQALEAKNPRLAVQRFESIRKLGRPGQLGSYSSIANEADKLYQQLVEQAQSALMKGQEQLRDDDQRFDGMLTIITANRNYQKLPEVKKELGLAERELARNPAWKDELKQAELLERAIALTLQKNSQKQLVTALENVVTRFPMSRASEKAQQILRELEGSKSSSEPAHHNDK